MSIQDAYNDWSASYDLDENLTRDLDGLVTRESLGAGHFQTVLEAGCGTGKNTELFSKVGKWVCAMDFSQGMLQRARQKVSEAHVQFLLADITGPWPWAGGIFDLISCNLILEHVRELPFIFEEAARVMRPEASLFISELHPFKQYQGKKAVYAGKAGQVEVEAFVHHLSDFVRAGTESGLQLVKLEEHWHEQDSGKPPRLVSFLFRK